MVAAKEEALQDCNSQVDPSVFSRSVFNSCCSCSRKQARGFFGAEVFVG